MNQDQRAAFEAWYMSDMFLCEPVDTIVFATDDNGYYLDSRVQAAWRGYKAALESPEVQQWKRDAERLDWIQDQAKESRSGVGFDWSPAYAEEGQVLEPKGWRFMRHHFLGDRKPNIREAIDAAMEKQK